MASEPNRPTQVVPSDSSVPNAMSTSLALQLACLPSPDTTCEQTNHLKSTNQTERLTGTKGHVHQLGVADDGDAAAVHRVHHVLAVQVRVAAGWEGSAVWLLPAK